MDKNNYCGIPINKYETLQKIKEKYTSADLDEHVHELKSEEASEINNRGMDYQLHYLMTECGVDWLEEVFLSEKIVSKGHREIRLERDCI